MLRRELSAFGRTNLSLVTTSRPTPRAHDVLVKIEAVSLNYRDLLILDDRLGPGYSTPLVPGSDFAGTIVEVGSEVARFQPGDRVINNDIAGWIDGAAAPQFDHAVATAPDKVALRHLGMALTYREVGRAVAALAQTSQVVAGSLLAPRTPFRRHFSQSRPSRTAAHRADWGHRLLWLNDVVRRQLDAKL
jgi:NADPH:quinone reductase-like Zn-dependent oxidoreductase